MTVAEHPFVTVTIYPVLIVGLTVMEVVDAPVLHLYAVPPLAVSVALLPLHIVNDGEAVIDGGGFIVTVRVAIEGHPTPFDAVTV